MEDDIIQPPLHFPFGGETNAEKAGEADTRDFVRGSKNKTGSGIYLPAVNSPEQLKKLNLRALDTLSGEIRTFLIQTLSHTGGHLASNLGVVELTLALHYVFQSPRDKIIWDVGHQAYVHKILTGRGQQFATLRQWGGLSGYPKSAESPHDAFDTGHSATSIAAAMGFCVSRDLRGEDYHVAAVIGDGSMTGGLAYEALNNAGRMNTNILVVLNDNQMSISENVGALSRHLNKLRTDPSYLGVKEETKSLLHKVPLGDSMERIIGKTKESIKYMLVPGVLFEELGFHYVGPVDGHNLKELITVLSKIKQMSGPVLLHVLTQKGKGYSRAENAPAEFHGVDSFDVETGCPLHSKPLDTYSDVFGGTLVSLAKKDDRIVAVTAAMPDGTGLAGFAKRFPRRLFDVGIAESYAVTFAAGMAKSGQIPVVAVYSSFLQRSYDQILHDVCLQKLHVIFALDRAGLVGADGETHQGVFDLSYLAHMPHMTVLAPANGAELAAMLAYAVTLEGPVAIRYPKGSAGSLRQACAELSFGKAEKREAGEDKLMAIVSAGAMLDTAAEVCRRLRGDGFSPTLYNARFIKPVDTQMAAELGTYAHVYTLEDNVRIGGFGDLLLARMGELGRLPGHYRQFAFPDTFIEQGSRQELFIHYGLDAESVYQRIRKDLEA